MRPWLLLAAAWMLAAPAGSFRVARLRLGRFGALRRAMEKAGASEAVAAGPSAADVGDGYRDVLGRAEAAAEGREAPPRLVAVSKTKPLALLEGVYEAGCRDFGENYAQELLEKAPEMPADVRWRFIGHMQSNKAKPLVTSVPNLVCVETVDSQKLAGKLQAAVLAAERSEPLGVMVQVNTSGEDSKSGTAPLEGALPLALFVRNECPNLRLDGLMTIGAAGDPSAFGRLVQTRDLVAAELGVEPATLELSMGMSGDFEEAVAAGSTSVRVGSLIFGARSYPDRK